MLRSHPPPRTPTRAAAMRVLRDPQIITGFIYEEPVDELPEFTHCGEAVCSQSHFRPPHSHPGFEFLYLSRGVCRWQTGGREYRQNAGDVFVARPREAHGSGPRPNSENQHLWVGLRLEEFSAEGRALAAEIRRHDIRLLSGCQEANPLLRALISQVVEMRPRRAEVTAALLDAFILLIRQRISMTVSAGGRASTKSLLPYSFGVQRAISYMRQNVDRRIPLRDFASIAGMRNVPHFCAQFHREVGAAPGGYHMQLRLEAAREALRQPAVEITTAALQFGFSSSQHFSTLFRRAFGTTPRAWKRREGEGNGVEK